MGTILLYELKKMMVSSTFFILLAFSIILFALNGAIFAHILTVRQEVYESLSKKYDGKFKYEGAPSPYANAAFATPPVLTSFIAEGGERKRPLAYDLNFIRGIRPLPLETNAKLPFIPVFDWVFIIKFIFCIYAFLLVFNAVSGERESGPLPLVLSNQVSRAALLAGKYLSACIGLAVPLATGMLISVLILSRTFPQVFSREILTSATMFFVASSVFLSAIVFLGLFVSSLGFRSSVTLLVLFSFWVGMMIIPNLSYLLANHSVHVMRDSDVARETERINNEFNSNTVMKRVMNNEFTSIDAVKEAGNTILAERKHLIYNLKVTRDNSLMRRADLTRRLSLASPLSVMQFTGEAIAGTGSDVNRLFMGKLAADMQVLKRYFTAKTGYDPEKVFRFDGMNFVAFKDSTFSIGGESLPLKTDFPDSPVVGVRTAAFWSFLPLTLKYCAILLLWNLVLALGAFIAFNRADVR